MKSASSKTSTCFDGSRQKRKKKLLAFFWGGTIQREGILQTHTHAQRVPKFLSSAKSYPEM